MDREIIEQVLQEVETIELALGEFEPNTPEQQIAINDIVFSYCTIKEILSKEVDSGRVS